MKTIDFTRIIKSIGFVFLRSNGHDVYGRGEQRIAVPKHKEMNRMIARRLLKEAGYQENVQEIGYRVTKSS